MLKEENQSEQMEQYDNQCVCLWGSAERVR